MPPMPLPLEYIRPLTTRVQTALDFVGGSFSSLHETVQSSLPEGQERALALTKLEESFDWAIKAVLRNQTHYSPDIDPKGQD